MSVVVTATNAIQNNSLKHRQFQEYLLDLQLKYGDLIFYTKIRWLSRGIVLERFWNLKEEIKIFMKLCDHELLEIGDANWLLDLSFLTDTDCKLNELNMKIEE